MPLTLLKIPLNIKMKWVENHEISSLIACGVNSTLGESLGGQNYQVRVLVGDRQQLPRGISHVARKQTPTSCFNALGLIFK